MSTSVTNFSLSIYHFPLYATIDRNNSAIAAVDVPGVRFFGLSDYHQTAAGLEDRIGIGLGTEELGSLATPLDDNVAGNQTPHTNQIQHSWFPSPITVRDRGRFIGLFRRQPGAILDVVVTKRRKLPPHNTASKRDLHREHRIATSRPFHRS